MSQVSSVTQNTQSLTSDAGSVTHLVQSGDTLSGIADRYGTSVDALMRANPGINDPDRIYAGDRLQIPDERSGALYTVQPGDVVSEIAQRHGISTDRLVAANELPHADLIYPGQVLRIPDAAAGAPPATTPATQPVETAPIAQPPAGGAQPSQLSMSDRGLDLVKEFESFEPRPYNDPAGHATIGYGHLLHYGPVTAADNAQWGTITEARATELLRSDVANAEAAVRRYVDVPLTQNQFDALTSFTFNVGEGAFRDSTLLSKLNAGDYAGAQQESGRWVHGGGEVLPGLVRRRAAEAEMFGSTAPAGGTQPTSPGDGEPASTTYTVRAGDTLSAIAARHGTTVDAIAQANGIANPNLIHVGQQLRIPVAGDAQPTQPAEGPGRPQAAGELPNTQGMSEQQRFDLYSTYVREFGDERAVADLDAGERVILGLRNDTSTRANNGNGVYDDRIVVMWQGADGVGHVREFAANTESSSQYEDGSPLRDRGTYGMDANGDGRLDLGRIADGTHAFRRDNAGGNFGPTQPDGNNILAQAESVRMERDSNHDGDWTAADAAQNTRADTTRGWFGIYFHRGGTDNTYSAGCQTMPQADFDRFWSSLGTQQDFHYVVVNADRLPATQATQPRDGNVDTSFQADGLPAPNANPSTLTDADFARAAQTLGVDEATIRAVAEVESVRGGFFDSGRPAILFEAHIFSDETGGRFDASHPDLSSPSWNRDLYVGGEGEYARLERAIGLDADAALMSASWGRFQIMGFNHEAAGYDNVRDFVSAMYRSEGAQLDAFVSFIRSNGLADELQRRDWTAFARAYNGPGYAANDYDTRMAEAYARYSAR